MKKDKELMFVIKAIPTAIIIISLVVALVKGELMGSYGLAVCIAGATLIMTQILQMAKITRKIAPQYIENNKRKH